MYLWNTKALADDLIKNEVPEFDKFIYLVVPIVLASVANGVESDSDRSINLLLAVLYAVVVTVLIFKCFSTYSKNKNKGFIEAFICLSFPLFIKAGLISLGLALVAMLLGIILNSVVSILVLIAACAPMIWMYIRLNYWLSYVSKDEASTLVT